MKVSDKEIIKESIELLANACEMLFECEDDNTKSLAFMVDCALKYAQVIHRGDNILLAAIDYDKYELEYSISVKNS